MFRQYAIPLYGYLTKDMKGIIAHVALTDHYLCLPRDRRKTNQGVWKFVRPIHAGALLLPSYSVGV